MEQHVHSIHEPPCQSGFHSNAVSKKGAQGLMQLMPGTASQLGVANSFDPNSNVEGGTKYLRELLEKYNYDPVKAPAAYNAGSQRVDKYHGVPPYYVPRRTLPALSAITTGKRSPKILRWGAKPR